MAKPEVVWEHILPDGRGIRFVRMNTKHTMAINERAMEAAGFVAGVPLSPGKLANAIQKEQVATLVRGVTIRPLDPVYVDAREATEEEKAKGQKPPQMVDLEATLVKYRPAEPGKPENPLSRFWKSLGYQSLTIEGDDHMLELFDDNVVWDAVLERIGAVQKAGGGPTTDPFRGLPSTRSA